MTKRFFLAFLLLILFINPALSQKTKRKPVAPKKPAAVEKQKKPAADEKEILEKALSETDLTQRIAALKQFITDFPKSSELTRAREILVSSRAQLADEKLRLGERTAGVELFKQAVADAPKPISDKLFTEVIVRFPTNLFFLGEQGAALEVANLIEEKISDNAKQLLGLATFYLGTENAAEALRLAEKAIALDANLPAAYQTLGLANRLAFQLEESEAAYARALELDPESAVSGRSLAEMKRASGKFDEAIRLYRELLEKNPEDVSFQTGLTLSLFDAGKKEEAEAELAKSLEKNPNNLFLLVGAAYWYAAHQQGEKAVEYGRRAVALEPRYTWAHVALARGFMAQKNPLEAERELLAARQYGNFPTLDYEIAAARLAAGLYNEAAQELSRNFVVIDDLIETKLGNRIAKQSPSFIELLELERRASIFEPLAADNPENAGKLKTLLRLHQTLSSKDASDEEITQAVSEFVKGDDNAKIFRQLYAANRLSQTQRNLPKALELTQGAISGVDKALDVPAPAAAVMADQLYDSRRLAISRNEVIVIPEIPSQTLSAIVRGRIEETAGWTLLLQNKPEEAVVRLKRAVSILPEKSAWWRSSTWKLGAALDAAGKQSEALDIYIKSYLSSEPDVVKRSVIETLYQKVNGNLEGLDQKIGAKPADTILASATPNETVAQNTEAVKTEAEPTPTIETTPETISSTETKSEPTPEVSPSPENSQTPQVESSPTPQAEISPTPDATPETKPQETPASSPTEKTETSEMKIPENTENKSPEVVIQPTPKPLFEPVIISIPKPEIPKPKIPALNSEKTSKTEPTDNSGETRPRLTSNNDSSSESSQKETGGCQLTVSQDSLSILSQGGSLGVLLGFQGEGGDISKIAATSSSPGDVEITLEPDIGKMSNRAFFIIKSVSPTKGAFTVTFDSPCGKKEVLVKVR